MTAARGTAAPPTRTCGCSRTRANFTGTAQDYVVGLPRSVRDHLSNSLAFREDPASGERRLYLIQGGNSAMGAPDNAWANRPERLLSAAVLEIDHTRNVSAGPINVQTQNPNVALPPGEGAVPGFHDPYAPNAPVTIFATGLRNGYDLVWHSNGSLYVPVNGSAAGGNTPDDPSTAINEALFGVSTQNDYLFKVVEGGYYGHPNPVRGEYILNGGNPTAGADPAQVGEYQVGVAPPSNYGGFAYDFSRNRSPNGAMEYTSNVFGDAPKGSLLVVEYSGGNDIVVLKLDAAGNVIGNDLLKNAAGNTITFSDPIDLVEHKASGRIYVASLADGSITLLTPDPGGVIEPPPPDDDGIYQAENATSPVGAVVATNQAGFEGTGFVDYTGAAGSSITWTISVDQAGTYELAWRYALSNAGANASGRPLTLTVNGQATGTTLPFLPTGAALTDWGFQEQAVAPLAGNNTITLTTGPNSGPNIDYLQVPADPIAAPVVEIDEQGRLQAEAATLSGPLVFGPGDTGFNTGADGAYADFNAGVAGEYIEWSFQVADTGNYDLSFRYALGNSAANASGRPLTLAVNGATVETLPFLPTGPQFTNWGTTGTTVALEAGETITVRLTSGAASGANLDYLEVTKLPDTNPNAELALLNVSGGGVPYPDRLVFSYIDNPALAGQPDRKFKGVATLRLSNTGTEALDLYSLDLDGPFEFVDENDANATSIAPGATLDLEIQFDRDQYNPATEPDIFTGSLRVVSSDVDESFTTVELAGFWQSVDEGGQEPDIDEVWQVFGYTSDINIGALDNQDIYEAVGDEVLFPYWKLAPGVTSATVTQLAAYHGPGGANFGIHAPGADSGNQGGTGATRSLFDHGGEWNQSILPLKGNGTLAQGNITSAFIPDQWNGADVFGIRVAGFSSDPRLNDPGPGTVPAGTQRGHFVRIFEAFDRDGDLIPNTYLVVQDYTGINYDYNDDMYVISGIAPVPELVIA